MNDTNKYEEEMKMNNETTVAFDVYALCAEIEKQTNELQSNFEKIHTEVERLKAIGCDNLTEDELANLALLRTINHVAITTMPIKADSEDNNLNTLIGMAGSSRGLAKVMAELMRHVGNAVMSR